VLTHQAHYFCKEVFAVIKPLGDRVVIEALEKDEKTASGIVLPETAKEKPQEGKVIAVGSGRYEDGQRIPLEVKEGDRVIFSKYAGTEVKQDDKEYLIMRESDILAIVE
jgi:chaperonin GroES